MQISSWFCSDCTSWGVKRHAVITRYVRKVFLLGIVKISQNLYDQEWSLINEFDILVSI
jgi:hypothetical protein